MLELGDHLTDDVDRLGRERVEVRQTAIHYVGIPGSASFVVNSRPVKWRFVGCFLSHRDLGFEGTQTLGPCNKFGPTVRREES